MDGFGIFKVSASAMEAQRLRMNSIASNMANVNTTKTEDGSPYKRRDVIFSSMLLNEGNSNLTGVKAEEVVKNDAVKTVYDPSHPDANKDGYVSMPNINTIEEMVNMMMAVRAYEASVSSFNMSKAMFMKTLELGRV